MLVQLYARPVAAAGSPASIFPAGRPGAVAATCGAGGGDQLERRNPKAISPCHFPRVTGSGGSGGERLGTLRGMTNQ